jgi:hypothetical protein
MVSVTPVGNTFKFPSLFNFNLYRQNNLKTFIMSYTIIYDKQFIKAEKDGKEVFLPMVYNGSNNCYESKGRGNGRRSRDWSLFTYILNGKKFGTLSEMLNNVEAYRTKIIKDNELQNIKYTDEGHSDYCDVYNDERFGYFTALAIGGSTHTTTFGKYANLFKSGCKNALTVEKLKEMRVNVRLYTCIFSEEERKSFVKAGKKEIDFRPETSSELIEQLEYFENYLKDFPNVKLYVSIDAGEYQMKHIRKTLFPKAKHEKQFVDVEQSFAVKIEGYGFLYELRGSKFRYTPYADSGKAFLTEKDANKTINKLKERFLSRFVYSIEPVTVKRRLRI